MRLSPEVLASRSSRLTFCLSLVILLIPTCSQAGTDPPEKLRGELASLLDRAPATELIPVSIVMSEQLDRETIERLSDQEHGREKIVARLKSLARTSQRQLIVQLRAHEHHGEIARIRSLWLTNVIGADATPAVIRALAERLDVAWINHNPKREVFLEPVPTSSRASSGSVDTTAGTDVETDWGVELMRAPEVWNDLGIEGRGAVVAVIDSGVCYEHPDIVNQIWVNPGEDLDGDGVVMDPSDVNGMDDDGNGFVDDLIGWDFDTNDNDPMDESSGHGSHVAGTIAGNGTSGHVSGMAPEAKIMVVRVGLTTSDEVDVWNGMQYAAENGAHAISMSLGWQHSWDPDRATWRQNCENVLAMGTTMVIAAGNEGAGNEPDNVRTPGDVPSIISVGATDSSDGAASFSSRGPVTWEDVPPYNDHPYPPGLTRPDVSAPGVSTRSHNFCSGYTNMSGTSMATPHVSGAVALMLEGDSKLTPAEVRSILEQTAIDLGDPGKDNTFGSGRVDAYEAAFEANRLLRYVDHQIDDSGDDFGNADSSLDPGEVAALNVTITNVDPVATAVGVVGYLVSETPGLVVLDNRTQYPDLAPGEFADPSGPPFTVKIETSCFTDAVLRLDLYQQSGHRSRNRFTMRVGSPMFDVLFDDDAESDTGWTVSGSALDGTWVRAVPQGTQNQGADANPPEDASPDGTRAFVTGNSGVGPTDDDVDGGETVLTSAALDASEFASAELSFWRWFYREGFPTSPPSEWFVLEVSDDGGQSWVDAVRLLAREAEWIGESHDLGALVSLTDQVVLRARVADETASGTDSVVEGGLDEVLISGDRIVCDDWLPPEYDPPPPVGNTLHVTRDGRHVRLDWLAPSPGTGEGPVSRYAVLRADEPGVTLHQVGGATRPEWWDVDEAVLGEPLRLYSVVSENGGGQSSDGLP